MQATIIDQKHNPERVGKSSDSTSAGSQRAWMQATIVDQKHNPERVRIGEPTAKAAAGKARGTSYCGK